MRRNNILTVVFALIFGFAGGLVSNITRITSAAVDPDALRAKRFELVNDAGQTIAFWGTDKWLDTAIVFVAKNDGGASAQVEKNRNKPAAFTAQNRTETAAFGMTSDGSPFLNLRGRDGKSRAIIQLTSQQKPMFVMSDEKWEGRVMLGFIPFDVPSPEEDDWGLEFRHPNLASIGVLKNLKDGTLSGTIAVRDSKGKTWEAP